MISSHGFETESNDAKSETGSTEDSVFCQPVNRGRSEISKKLRSIRLKRISSKKLSSRGSNSRLDTPSMLSSADTRTTIEISDSSPNYMKATSSSHAKESFQNSQIMLPRKSLTRMTTVKLKRSLTRKLSGNKSQRVVTRKLSFKPVRILTKMSTFKMKKISMEESSQKSQTPESSLRKATCSSTLKDPHFPDHIEIPEEVNGSQSLTTMRVCRYTYCSLHGGHHHDNVPPLKRFVSMRRRLLKTQRSMKTESQAVTRSKQSGNKKKGTQKSQSVQNADPALCKTPHSGRYVKRQPARDSVAKSFDAGAITSSGRVKTGGNNEEISNLKYYAEVLLGETSYPHLSFEENLSGALSAKGHNFFSSIPIKGTSSECCSIGTKKEKTYSIAMKTARKIKTDASKKTATNDAELEAEVSQEIKGERNSVLKLANPESVGGNPNAYDLTCASGQLTVESNPPNSNYLLKSASANISDMQILKGATATQSINMEPDSEVLKESSLERESKPAFTADASYTMQERDSKYIKMWHLIYKHAMISNTGKGEEKEKVAIDRADKEARGQDNPAFNDENGSSCQDDCETDREMDSDNERAVELVQKAFDEILLPETEGLSSNDDLNTRGITSDQELVQKSQDKSEERNISISAESLKEEEKTKETIGNKPEQKIPKNWSYLKKLILLKRFVNALEKVRKIYPRKHRQIPSDANVEAEKVHLRRQTLGEKKNAEEWMLDYALQKVISKLGPAQKQRVALLVEAFETIRPFQDTENSLQSFAKRATQANSSQNLSDSSDHSKEEAGREMDYAYSAKLWLGKASFSQNSLNKYADNAIDDPVPEQHNPDVLKEKNLDSWTETLKNKPASRSVDEDWNEKQRLGNSYSKEETGRELDCAYSAQLLLQKASFTQNSLNKYADNADNNLVLEPDNQDVLKEKNVDSLIETLKNKPASRSVDEDWNEKQKLGNSHSKGEDKPLVDDKIYLSELKNSRLQNKSFSKPDELRSSRHEEAPTKENEVPQGFILNSNTEILNRKSELHSRDFDSKSPVYPKGEQHSTTKSLLLKSFARSLGSNLATSEAPELFDESTACRKERIEDTKLETGTSESFSVLQESEAQNSAVVEPKTKPEKQNYTRLWYLIYKHMASAKVAEDDPKPLVDEKQLGYDASRMPVMNHMNQDTETNDHTAADPEVELHQTEAIKMVEEAIDAIISDAEEPSSLTDTTVPDNSKQSNGTESVHSEDISQKEASMKSGNELSQEQEESVANEENKPNKQLPRSWSNLKKVILLRRFIKSLEKVRKFNPRGPRYLPLEPDPEAEKVQLRHQDVEGRKEAEEWMLDHALRRVVSQLTPARKRKVEMLVEAFETVMPTIKS